MTGSKQNLFWLASLLLLVAYLVFPGNVDWICDQPLLIAKALESNQFNRWGDFGIAGGNGTVYGPVPNFLYQLLLTLTHDLKALVVIKALFSFLLIFISLFRISQDLNLTKWGILFSFLSPLIYFYSRSLWDNVFLIPFSALFSSAVIRFCLKQSWIEFIIAVITAGILFHIHLMSTIVIIPGMALLNFLAFKRKGRDLSLLLATQLFILFLSWPYLKTLFIDKTFVPYGKPQWPAIILSPILGLRLFGYFGFFEYFSPNFFSFFSTFGKALAWGLITLTAFGPLCYLAGLRIVFNGRASLPKYVRIYFLSVLVTTLLISFKMKLRAHPHYMNASWSVYFCIFWLAFHEGVKIPRFLFVSRVYVVAMVALLFSYIFYIQFNSGDRGLHFGPTMENQISVMKQLPRINDLTELEIDVENIANFPQRLLVLSKLYGSGPGGSGKIKIGYVAPFPSAEIGILAVKNNNQ